MNIIEDIESSIDKKSEHDMMISPNFSFLLPTKKLRRLSILLTIYHEPRISQHRIAAKTGLSGSMINSYLKEMIGKEMITTSRRNRRDREYHLTPEGRDCLNSLLIAYSAEIIQLYSHAKKEMTSRLKKGLDGMGECKVVLFGGSETADLVIRAIKDLPQARIVGVVDNDSQKWQQAINGYPIAPPSRLKEFNPDVIIVASYGKQEEIYQSIRHLEETGTRILKLSTL